MRNEIQIQAIKSWIENDKVGTIVLPTGTGKTFVGATIAAKQLLNKSIDSVLIVVPTTALIEQWKKEIIKFYGEEIIQSKWINIQCIQTVYKHEGYVDLLIIDEIHTALSDKYSDVFDKITYNQILGLTATVPAKPLQLEILNKHCPVVYSKLLAEISNQDIVAKYKIFNLEVPLTRSDRGKYQLFDSQLKRAQMELGLLKYRDENLKKLSIFDIAKEYSKSKLKEPIVKYSKQFWSAMTLRKWVCYEAESKINVVINILNQFPTRKWIIFNKSVKFAEKLKKAIPYPSVIYHHKMNEKEREKALADFEANRFNILITVDALNAGLNVPEVDSAICVSGVSTELVATQQAGQYSAHTH